jgi:cell division protein FtsI/penicillin-binding protein 2
MGKRLQTKRLLWLVGGLCLAFTGLALRLAELQVLRHEELHALAEENTVRKIRIQPRRGDILDARGNLLASSTMVKTIYANPTLLTNRQAEVARAIAPILGMNEADLFRKLQPATYVNKKGQTVPDTYVVLTNKVTLEAWAKVRETMANLKFAGVDEKSLKQSEKSFYSALRKSAIGADVVEDQVRKYHANDLAAHVLGFVGRNGDTNSADFGQLIGVDGIERTFDDKLSGTQGWRVTELDRYKREIVSMRDQNVPARDGFNVVLTIDSVIQHELENALEQGMKEFAPINITGIVVRPGTGEILAMASLPDFNPNKVPRDPELRKNRLITDFYEPGSTFKIVPVAGALSDGKIKLSSVFNCENGLFRYAGVSLHDHHSYGPLTVEKIITFSSNIGAAKVGLELGENRLFEHISNFGFGMPTGIQLPSESPGLSHPVKKWSKVTIAQIPMGHGIAVTRLQMAMAMAAIANDGWLMRPMLVSRLEDGAGNIIAQYQPQRVRRAVSESAAADMVKALKTVVSTGGTATKAGMTNYAVAGKTGTAQKPGKGGYVDGKFISSFIGFFPADKPEICISIVLDEPSKNGHFGGVVAAPVFHEVATAVASYLHIVPDKNVGEVTSVGSGTSPVDVQSARTVASRASKTQ